MFLEFVEGTTSGVTAQGASPGWGTVTLLLAQEDGQLGAQLSMSRVFYILQSPANLISLAKLNDVGLCWGDRTWGLYDAKELETQLVTFPNGNKTGSFDYGQWI